MIFQKNSSRWIWHQFVVRGDKKKKESRKEMREGEKNEVSKWERKKEARKEGRRGNFISNPITKSKNRREKMIALNVKQFKNSWIKHRKPFEVQNFILDITQKAQVNKQALKIEHNKT